MSVNRFPCTESAGLTELKRLRRDIDASRQRRAKDLLIEHEMVAEAAMIEAAEIASIMAHNPPHAITPDTEGAYWQVVGDHLRQVPRGDGRRAIEEPVTEAEQAVTPATHAWAKQRAGDCGCGECRELVKRLGETGPGDEQAKTAAATGGCLAVEYGLCACADCLEADAVLFGGPAKRDVAVKLVDDSPGSRVRSVRDWIVGGMTGAEITRAVDGAERAACGGGVRANGHHDSRDC